MPPFQTNEIIDLCSESPGVSQSPVRVRTRAQSRARSVCAKESAWASKTVDLTASDTGTYAGSNSKGGEGKGKQPLRSLGPIIELSDSEDEKENGASLASRGTLRREQNQGFPSGSWNVLGSSLNAEQAKRNVLPDLTGEPSRFSVPDVGKGKGREVDDTNAASSNEDDKQPVINDEDYMDVDTPPMMTVVLHPEERQPPIPGPSNQPAVVPAPAPSFPVHVPGPVHVADPDPPTQTLARILEVVPNVDPEFLYPHIATQLPNFGDDPIRTAELILGGIFEMGDKVPRIQGNAKGKRKNESWEAGAGGGAEAKERDGNDDERKGKKAKVDWASVDRPFQGTGKYLDLALIHLQTSFPLIPKRHLRRRLMLHNCHYAPTHLALLESEKADKKDYEPKLTRYSPEKDRAKSASWKDPVLEEERAWIVEREQEDLEEGGKQDKGKGKAKTVDEEPELEDGEGIECQCCFCEYPFDKMVQCPEAHLFCTACISQYASTQLGSHCATLVCMHSSECKQPFPESELRRVLDGKLMDLYERVKQQKEIEDAGLEDLEECPFCEWKCVIEASKEQEKLFRCGNEEGGCGVVSCRLCKKEDHLPRSCKELENDKHLDSQHVVEEAMTQALMRQCPKCKKPFIKEAGCNKMTCPHCRTLSCYICRQIINGYDHFNQASPTAPSGSRKSSKCLLWDSVEQRHADEVKAAAEKAMTEFKKSNPDVDPSAIKVDIPKAPPAVGVGPGGMQYNQNVNNNNQFNLAAMHAHQARIQQMAQAQAGVWGAGVHMPAAGLAQAAPQVPVLPPAPVPALRGAGLIAQARRGARRRGANPGGPRIARHAQNVRVDPPIPHRRSARLGAANNPIPAPLQPVVAAPAPPPAPPAFQFEHPARGGLGDGIALQQPVYDANANVDIAPQQQQQQRLREAFEVNERIRQNEMARQRIVDALDARAMREGRGGGIGDPGVRTAVLAPANPPPVDGNNQLEQRLVAAQQRVLRDRMVLMRQQQRQMERANANQLRMYQGERQGVGGLGLAGGGGLPMMMGYNAGFGMPMVPQNFGAQQPAQK